MPRVSIIIDVSRNYFASIHLEVRDWRFNGVKGHQSTALLAPVLSDSMLVSRNAVLSSSLESTVVGVYH